MQSVDFLRESNTFRSEVSSEGDREKEGGMVEGGRKEAGMKEHVQS